MKLKVCGLKYKENIEQIAQLKVDYLGFIFYPKSKRYVGEDFEMPLITSKTKTVGVFVNADLNYIIEKVNKYNLDIVQLHGDETADYCRLAKEQLKNIEIIKAFGVNEQFNFDTLNTYTNHCNYFLFDTKTKEYGGSGYNFDWKILEKYDDALPYFLSGGIGLKEAENIKNEKTKLNAYAIDVNSKFEIEPGFKNVEMIETLINNLLI
jgi:phosphoribosylanthranilate isomerase